MSQPLSNEDEDTPLEEAVSPLVNDGPSSRSNNSQMDDAPAMRYVLVLCILRCRVVYSYFRARSRTASIGMVKIVEETKFLKCMF